MKPLKPRHHAAIIVFIILLTAIVFSRQIGPVLSFFIVSYSFGLLVVLLLWNVFDNFLKNRFALRLMILFLTYLAFSRFAVWLDTKQVFYLINALQFVLSVLCFIFFDIFGQKEKSSVVDENDSTENPS
jgi:hypothetical protein